MMHRAITIVICMLQPAASDATPRATWQARAFSVDNRVLFARRYVNVSTDREDDLSIPHKLYICSNIQPCCGDVTDGFSAMRFQNSRSLLLWIWGTLSEILAIG